jgi:hypothetical protein
VLEAAAITRCERAPRRSIVSIHPRSVNVC